MSIDIRDVSGLKELNYESFDDSNEEYILFNCVPVNQENPVCPACGMKTYVHDTQYREAWDLPAFGKKTLLRIKAKRYRCFTPMCNKHNVSVYPEFTFLEKGANITLRLKELIANQSFYDQSFENISRNLGPSIETVRQIFLEKARAYDSNVKYKTPTILGVDEVHLWQDRKHDKKEYNLVLVDESKEKVALIDIFSNRTSETLRNALENFDNPDGIIAVTMDMTKGYRSAVNLVLPNAKVIADRWHVLKDISKELTSCVNKYLKAKEKELSDQIDKLSNVPKALYTERDLASQAIKMMKVSHILFKNLSSYTEDEKLIIHEFFKSFPVLEYAFKIYQDLAGVYEYNSRELATVELNTWIQMSKAICKNTPELSSVISQVQTISCWKNEILNYFDFPDVFHRTNGPTEGINSEIKRVNSYGRGYKFEVLRAKLLYGNSKVKVVKGQMLPMDNTQFMRILDGSRNYFDSLHNSYFAPVPVLSADEESVWRLIIQTAIKINTRPDLNQFLEIGLSNPTDSMFLEYFIFSDRKLLNEAVEHLRKQVTDGYLVKEPVYEDEMGFILQKIAIQAVADSEE